MTNQIVPFINCSINLYSGLHDQLEYWVYGLVFNATFNYFSVISWRSVLFVGETGVLRENYRPVTSHWQTLSHNVVSSTPHPSGIRTHNYHIMLYQVHLCWVGFELTTLVVIGTDCIGSYKFNLNITHTLILHVLFLFLDIGWEDYICQAQGWV